MKTACTIVLVASCVCVSFCYPSKPLNERSTELAWEAWLLVDQSNRQGDLGVLRRRITPKSVFIAPTFSPESLPACAEGYISDSMGRCMQIVKINESNHLNFLLEKLKQRFPSPDYQEETNDTSTQGPLQFNIPLLDNDDEILVENETNVAIVVTPSNRIHDKTTASVKVDVKRNGNDRFNVENVAAILRVKPEDVEMTTIAELTTATTFTTMKNDDETTTLQFTTTGGETTETTTENDETTTLLEGDAIFFRWKI
ncbi:hypothetical protein BDFB_005524 [Asbolus verrucosus]|uniref:Uncharacterized protein n=1 Tax=Asbolus verrucosus TaxID=1661398 RepID=A0A482VAP5_ASBVE|nr:hypothetical protein BDFB_005524 [Asbolus verrucosus]